MSNNDQNHIIILKAFDDLKFNLGRKTFIDFIKGNPNSTIERNNLDELHFFGSLYMLDEEEIENIILQLINENYIQINEIRGGFKVLIRTLKGTCEIFEKKFKLKEKKQSNYSKVFLNETKITEDDLKQFKTFDFFLSKFNNEQKKAIISQDNNILCIAGAGSGKTTVLTKRIEFLKKFKSVKEEDILAITFTKKAKQEMINRLKNLDIFKVRVETFNSFSEKKLQKYGNLIYLKPTRVAKYGDKISLVKWAFEKLGTKFEIIVDDYFNKKQLKEKSVDELFFIFVNDIFSIIDYYKNLEEKLNKFYKREKNYRKKNIAKLMYDIVYLIQLELKKRGLRDFSDQVVDTLNLFRNFSNTIPKFKYILIDEYQDLNLVQFELIKLLSAPNLFAVGDPRQAIFGWRGSNIKFIMDFPKVFKNTKVISLKKNYRSYKQIVDLCNQEIKPMKLLDLEIGLNSQISKEKSVFIQEFDSEFLERLFVMEAIKNSKSPRNEIFILARTNRILLNFSEILIENGIDFLIKSDDDYQSNFKKNRHINNLNENQVVLATVHSIKGMEAKEVYVVGSNSLSYPNKVQDNFVLELVKEDNDYNKYEEELRLFYVALSRAKERLIITYTGNLTKFLTKDCLDLVQIKKKNKNLFDFSTNHKKIRLGRDSQVLISMLKEWRSEKAKSGIPLYMIISNRAIEELAKYKPQSKAEMFSIHGLGATKIAKYGDELLKIICG